VSEAVRTLVVWCPDWPVVAAGVPLDEPAIVVRASRVVACSPAARAEGVALRQRRREAQAKCPEVVVVDHDPAVDVRAFEPVAAALEALTPRIEVVEPGCCSFPTRGPSRYHGGDVPLAERASYLAAAVLAGRGTVRVGVADGPFAARLAARTPGDPVLVVEPGTSRDFLAGRSVRALDRPELVDVLERLGIRTLGALAALAVNDVVGRFGAEGWVAHRLANGFDERPPATSPPPVDLSVTAELDPPAERVEAAAFVARGMADELGARLAERGSACTRLVIGAETEHGERHERVWRTEGTFTSGAIADRMRWQVDGWLQAGVDRPTGGLTRLWLAPDEVVPAGGRQLAFASGGGVVDAVEAADRAARALARVQGLAGVEAVHVAEWRGGRGPGERVRLVPAAAVDVTEPRPAAQPGWVAEPWPGQVPAPAPAIVHDPPLPAEVLDGTGRPVTVSGRGEASVPPATVAIDDRSGKPARTGRWSVHAWAGPWPCDENWWDPERHRRRARAQVVLADGTAHLLVVEAGRWSVEATYD
jgi:protein ImuB